MSSPAFSRPYVFPKIRIQRVRVVIITLIQEENYEKARQGGDEGAFRAGEL
jgi:hypothetical protein